MSFQVVPTDHDPNQPVQSFETFDQLMDYIREQLAFWNNFEVEKGNSAKTFTVIKPQPETDLAIQVAEMSQVKGVMGG
jgi:hypothetical protein